MSCTYKFTSCQKGNFQFKLTKCRCYGQQTMNVLSAKPFHIGVMFSMTECDRKHFVRFCWLYTIIQQLNVNKSTRENLLYCSYCVSRRSNLQ